MPTWAGRGGAALVAMAFLGVLREGFGTAVFMLAAFSGTHAARCRRGCRSGVAVAVGRGYGIYRGGVRISLSKFFRATGLVLVLVAAGLLVSAAHTAHEAGWLNSGKDARSTWAGWSSPARSSRHCSPACSDGSRVR